MSVLVQNKTGQVEYVTVVYLDGKTDTVTVQPGGRVTLPRGYKVKETGVTNAGLKVTGNDKPSSSLAIKE